jgi:hypothetical protein
MLIVLFGWCEVGVLIPWCTYNKSMLGLLGGLEESDRW